MKRLRLAEKKRKEVPYFYHKPLCMGFSSEQQVIQEKTKVILLVSSGFDRISLLLFPFSFFSSPSGFCG